MKLGMQVGLGPWPHCVRWGSSSPAESGTAAPTFEIYGRPYNPQSMSIVAKPLDGSKMPLGSEVGVGPGHTVLDGDPILPPPKGHSPSILAHVCCGQTARWIKMPLGRR